MIYFPAFVFYFSCSFRDCSNIFLLSSTFWSSFFFCSCHLDVDTLAFFSFLPNLKTFLTRAQTNKKINKQKRDKNIKDMYWKILENSQMYAKYFMVVRRGASVELSSHTQTQSALIKIVHTCHSSGTQRVSMRCWTCSLTHTNTQRIRTHATHERALSSQWWHVLSKWLVCACAYKKLKRTVQPHDHHTRWHFLHEYVKKEHSQPFSRGWHGHDIKRFWMMMTINSLTKIKTACYTFRHI